jgi:hypothetical protein
MFGFFKKKIDWNWWLQNACHMLKIDDDQLDKILEALNIQDRESPEYLFTKYKYRLISIYYVITAAGLKLSDAKDSEFLEFQEKLKITAIAGNPNPFFSIDNCTLPEIDFETIAPLIDKIGSMNEYHDICLKTIAAHIGSSDESGSGSVKELGSALYALYASSLESMIDVNDLSSEKADTFMMYFQGAYRSQSGFARKLINS